MKTAPHLNSIDSAAFGSLMDPGFLRRAVDDSDATVANVTHEAAHGLFDWRHLRQQAEALRDWVLHRPAH